MLLWDKSFRLIINELPSAPVNSFAEVAHADAAKEVVVKFLVPRGTKAAKLKIAPDGSEQTTLITLNLPEFG